jgi:hypothetical protein
MVGPVMAETARFIESFIGVLITEAEDHGLTEVARLLRAASREAADQARLLALDTPQSEPPPDKPLH